MIITKKALDRRLFLRGMGAALALPLLDSMVPALATAQTSQAKTPIRMTFCYTPNGIIPASWLPSEVGTSFDFKPTLMPLRPFRDKLVVLSNLAQNNGRSMGDGPGDHARASATWLTGVHPKKTGGADIHAGISADQIAAKALASETQFGSLEIGLEENYLAGSCDSGYSCAYSNTVSWRSATAPNPCETSPRALFERLFGDGDTTDSKTRITRMQEDRSILDFVRGDVARLKTGLGNRDRGKLEEYLEGIRDIEKRLQRAEQQAATADVLLMDRPAGTPATFEEHARIMSDLMLIAFQTDMTRVITFMMAREGSNRSYREIDIPDGHHSLTHHQHDPAKIAKVQKIDALHAKSLAYLVTRLDETLDGDGTLLDHTMLLYGSSIRDGNIHDHRDLPLVLLGGRSAGIRGGRHIRYKAETPMTNLLLTMLDKAGVPADSLGDSTGRLDQLSDL